MFSWKLKRFLHFFQSEWKGFECYRFQSGLFFIRKIIFQKKTKNPPHMQVHSYSLTYSYTSQYMQKLQVIVIMTESYSKTFYSFFLIWGKESNFESWFCLLWLCRKKAKNLGVYSYKTLCIACTLIMHFSLTIKRSKKKKLNSLTLTSSNQPDGAEVWPYLICNLRHLDS